MDDAEYVIIEDKSSEETEMLNEMESNVADGDSDDDFAEEVEISDENPPIEGSKDSKEAESCFKIHSCSICGKTFSSKAGARYHSKHHHTESKMFCLKCRKPFKFAKDLDRHMNIHKGLRPFDCVECDKSFVCKSSLMQHVKFQHIVGKIMKCPLCEKSFCTETDLNRHVRIHTGIKPYHCEQCDKRFVCKSSLNMHKRTHEGKKFHCTSCDKQFYIQSDLDRHQTKHTGKKPWVCKLCEKSYSCKSTLKVHEKNIHSFQAEKQTTLQAEKQTTLRAERLASLQAEKTNTLQVEKLKKLLQEKKSESNIGSSAFTGKLISLLDKSPNIPSQSHKVCADSVSQEFKHHLSENVNNGESNDFDLKTKEDIKSEFIDKKTVMENIMKATKQKLRVGENTPNKKKRLDLSTDSKTVKSEEFVTIDDVDPCSDTNDIQVYKSIERQNRQTLCQAIIQSVQSCHSPTRSGKSMVVKKKEISEESAVVPL